MKTTIKQIIPCQEEIYAIFKDETEDKGYHVSKVIYLALVELQHGLETETEVLPINSPLIGDKTFVITNDSNFISLVTKEDLKRHDLIEELLK